MSAGFVHLHVHSDYSVLDGACKVHELLERCEQYAMKACALTDHGNMFGAIEFFQAAKKKGIKPIIGCELYLAPGGRRDNQTKYYGSFNNHLLALCESTAGYHNLCKLSTIGYLEGHYYKPRVDEESLYRHREGLIVTTSCLAGRIPQAILNNDLDAADAQVRRFIEVFGKDNFLVELMNHDMEEQRRVNPVLCELAEKHGLMLIATNDCHYLDRSDYEAHDALLCIQTQAQIEDEKRLKFSGNQYYFASPDEMRARFAQWPEAVANTEKIADRCNVEIPLGQSLIPHYQPPEGYDGESYLRELVRKGLESRYGSPPPEAYAERAEFEIGVIAGMKFVDYFLVVWDLINFANEHGIPVGPGRGSGAGSIVAYALRITNIDPMRYHLLFERFLNPDRVTLPDFDIDFCERRRGEMIQYAIDKYGKDNVSQIITYGRMLAKAVVRNVARVLGMSPSEGDRIAKLIPNEPKITLDDAYGKEPELKRMVDGDPQIARLWRIARRLEGTIGNCGTHAAGVVICDHPLTDHVPLYKAANSETVATQAEMKCVEEVGLLKMDFLGLRTLTMVHDAVALVRESRGIEIDINNVEPNDEKTYAMLRTGNTFGVFQLESSGMRDVARRIGLQSLEEMSALVALYRPGPMQNIDTYIENKFNPGKIVYDHPLLEPILKETYGVAVYQEQVMQIVKSLAGFTLGEADLLRRAMGKKKADLMAEQRDKFVAGCKAANGIGENLAKTLFDRIETFAGYGFNKSHSVAYAFVAYQTAYLKANFPVEFMCALLTSESGNLDKIAMYVEECRRMGIEVMPPDVNCSRLAFTVEGGVIRFGLGAIKNVGEGPIEAIVAERNANGAYADLYDFCSRLDTRLVNRRLVESLNKAGAFGSSGWNRRQIESAIDSALSEGQTAQRDRASGQSSLFDLSGMEEAAETMRQKPNLPEWPEHELLLYEKEVMGLYVSSHPLARHARTLERFNSFRLEELPTLKDGAEIGIGGLVASVRPYLTQKGKMAFVALETLEGSCEVTVFTDLYEQKSGLLQPDAIVMIKGRISYRNNEPGIVANDLFPLEEAERQLTRAVHVRLDLEQTPERHIERLATLLGEHPGSCDVFLHCVTPGLGEVVMHAIDVCRVAPARALRNAVEDLLGEDTCWFSAGQGLPTHSPPRATAPDQPRWKQRAAAAT